MTPEDKANAIREELFRHPYDEERILAKAIRQAENDTQMALRAKLSPRFWTREMSDAWHRKIPDVQAAFDAILDIALKHKDDSQ